MFFFFILTAGVLIPEVKEDLTETHIIIREELAEQRTEFRQLFREELQQFLENPAVSDLLKENAVSSRAQTRS